MLFKMFQRKTMTYCLPTCNAEGSGPLPPSSSEPGGRRRRRWPHCPLSSGCALGGGSSSSSPVGTETRKAGGRRVNTQQFGDTCPYTGCPAAPLTSIPSSPRPHHDARRPFLDPPARQRSPAGHQCRPATAVKTAKMLPSRRYVKGECRGRSHLVSLRSQNETR